MLIDLLYSKSLSLAERITPDGLKQTSVGTVVTLMSVDTERIRIFLSYSHDLSFRTPFSITIAICGLLAVLGWPAFVGIGVTIIMVAISTVLGRYILKLQEILLKRTDARVSIINEILQGVRIVKYFAWESFLPCNPLYQ